MYCTYASEQPVIVEFTILSIMFMTYITNVDISSTRADKKPKANRPIIEQDCQTTESQAQD